MQKIRFGTDGWRGVIADDFTFAAVRRVAEAVARRLPRAGGAGALVVGHDTRFLAPAFARAAAEVLAAQGLTAYLTSTFAPTPAFGWAAVERGADGAIVITASHNPPEYCGFKLKDRHGAPAPPEVTAEVEAEMDRPGETATLRQAQGGRGEGPMGRIVAFDPRPSYLKRLADLADLGRIAALRAPVVVDAMCGAGQGYLAGFLAERGLRVTELAAELNPLFGGRQPEPVPANLRDLQAACRARGAVGFALDGDADRLAVVDERGRAWSPHQLMAVAVDHMARRRGGRGRIVKGFAVGRQVDAVAAAAGLSLTVVPIGFKYIAAHMLRGDVLVGGEESGGIGVQGHLPERDGSLVALLVLEAMAGDGCPAADLLDRLEARVGPSHYRRVDWDLPRDLAREAILARLAGLRRGLPGQGPAALDELDGLKLRFQDESWILFRPSGTEPLLRVYAEAADPARLDRLMDAAAVAVREAVGDVIEERHGKATA
ncbi:MAG TPA: phosphoglucomutase/phosphomannomutase family protein [Candidatus Methylomirabilis sp.]|jgi:phosphomannomutase